MNKQFGAAAGLVVSLVLIVVLITTLSENNDKQVTPVPTDSVLIISSTQYSENAVQTTSSKKRELANALQQTYINNLRAHNFNDKITSVVVKIERSAVITRVLCGFPDTDVCRAAVLNATTGVISNTLGGATVGQTRVSNVYRGATTPMASWWEVLSNIQATSSNSTTQLTDDFYICYDLTRTYIGAISTLFTNQEDDASINATYTSTECDNLFPTNTSNNAECIRKELLIGGYGQNASSGTDWPCISWHSSVAGMVDVWTQFNNKSDVGQQSLEALCLPYCDPEMYTLTNNCDQPGGNHGEWQLVYDNSHPIIGGSCLGNNLTINENFNDTTSVNQDYAIQYPVSLLGAYGFQLTNTHGAYITSVSLAP
jgi:hypothetical protein